MRSCCRKPVFLLVIAVLICFSVIRTEAAWKTFGSVTGHAQRKSNSIILTTTGGGKVKIEFFDIDVIRIRMSPAGVFEREFSYDFDYSHERHLPLVKVAE